MFILFLLISIVLVSSGPIKIGDDIWRHVHQQFGVSQEDCEGGFRPLYSSTPKPKTFNRSFGFHFTLNSSQEELFKPHSAAIISHMIDTNSSKCRFMLKTSELGSSAGELSCIQCNREPTALQHTSSGLPSSHLPFSIYHDEEETSHERGQAAAPRPALAVRSKFFLGMYSSTSSSHLGSAEQISKEQSVGLDTVSAVPSRPEKVEQNDGDKQNMGQGARKKNRSFLSRIFRRK